MALTLVYSIFNKRGWFFNQEVSLQRRIKFLAMVWHQYFAGMITEVPGWQNSAKLVHANKTSINNFFKRYQVSIITTYTPIGAPKCYEQYR